MKLTQLDSEEILSIFSDQEIMKNINGSSILVTGATGLIGQNLIRALLYADKYLDLDICIYAFVRDKKRAEKVFSEFENINSLEYIEGEITDSKINLCRDIDYIIHGAAVTKSKMFVEKPVETINVGIIGTENILELAKCKKVKSIVYLSSMEVYGEISEKKELKESDMGYLNPLSIRSSYSESKRMIENICVSYFSEYKVPVKIVRLTQTFGPGVNYNDKRVFAEFARCAIELKDIVLHTEGLSERMYLYTLDAVGAIITILIKGENGEAYNAANEKTYCSIKQMAEMIQKDITENAIEVLTDLDSTKTGHYSPEHHLYLNTSKLKNLGWNAKTDLLQAYKRMIRAMECER